MNKICTSIEQSKKLIELGIDVNSADMYYEEVCNLPKAIVGNYILHNQCMEDKDYKKLSHQVLSPAWSLSALLKILPLPTLEETMITTTETKWKCTIYCESYTKYWSELHNDAIDAAFEMICWLKENEKI